MYSIKHLDYIINSKGLQLASFYSSRKTDPNFLSVKSIGSTENGRNSIAPLNPVPVRRTRMLSELQTHICSPLFTQNPSVRPNCYGSSS